MKSRSGLILCFILFFLLLTIASCAPAETTDVQYGFLFGILHGVLFPFAVIGKVFNFDVGLYAMNNTGTLYWIGYLIGVIIICGGGSRAG